MIRWLACVVAACAASPASAAEGGQYAGPVGGSDIRSAYLPSEGVFVVPFSYFGAGSRFAGPDGRRSANVNDVAFSFGNVGGAVLAVWPWHPWNTNIASSFEDNIVTGCGKIGQRGGTVLENCATNLVDPYVDLFIVSKYFGSAGTLGMRPGDQAGALPYGLTASVALSGSIPIANTSPNKPAVGGKGSWIASPSISLTYLTGRGYSFFDGTEVSTRLYYETSSSNYRGGYRNGDVVVADFALTQRAGLFQAGIAGTFAAQVTADKPSGQGAAPNKGNKLTDFQLGPVVAYDIPAWRASLSAKGLVEVHSRNRLQINGAIVRLAFRVF